MASEFLLGLKLENTSLTGWKSGTYLQRTQAKPPAPELLNFKFSNFGALQQCLFLMKVYSAAAAKALDRFLLFFNRAIYQIQVQMLSDGEKEGVVSAEPEQQVVGVIGDEVTTKEQHWTAG